MMSKIWGVIIVGGIIYGLLTGRSEELSNIILSLPNDAFNLVVTLVVSASFWSGFMHILSSIGVVEKIAKLLNPFLRKIMPTLDDKYALECISTNIAANMLGLGFAATPSGLKGIKRLKELSTLDKDVASDDMVTFLVLNTAGVTLLPTTVMSIRQALGSKHPLDFVFIGIFATICASFVGLMLDRHYRRKKK